MTGSAAPFVITRRRPLEMALHSTPSAAPAHVWEDAASLPACSDIIAWFFTS